MKLSYSPSTNRFCAPAALAALAGISIEKAESLLKEELGDVQITGVYYPMILKILEKLGYHYLETISVPFKLNYLIVYNGHVGAWIDGQYIDNQNPNGLNHIPNFKKVTRMFEILKRR